MVVKIQLNSFKSLHSLGDAHQSLHSYFFY
jgi:hypothetical protein